VASRHRDSRSRRGTQPASEPDPGWLPLIATPPYPSYAGNLAIIGASAARSLQLAFGTNDIPVAIRWRQSGGLPDVTHHFDGFWQAAEEESLSRIYGGIHTGSTGRRGSRSADRWPSSSSRPSWRHGAVVTTNAMYSRRFPGRLTALRIGLTVRSA
jgi:hypothetical protein